MNNSRKISVLILIDSLCCGGAEKSLVSLLPSLIARGYDLTLMRYNEGGLFEQLVPEGVKETIVPRPKKSLRLLLSRLLLSLRLRLPGGRKRHGAELFWSFMGRHFPTLSQEFDVAIAYQQGFPTYYISEKVKARKKITWANVDLTKAGYLPDFCRPFYDKYDSVVAVSEILADKIHTDGFVSSREKIHTVYDILSESLIRSLAEKGTGFDRTDNALHITTVGRLMPQKGYDLAIGAAAILAAEGLAFKWHIVGGGPLEDSLREMIEKEGLQDCVILEGVQLNPYPFIKNCDIYVQTSRFEGFGLTVGEAKILHKPIVSTDFPVIHNQLTQEVNGLITSMDAIAIADAILRLAKSPELRSALTSRLAEENNTTELTESEKVIKLIEGTE